MKRIIAFLLLLTIPFACAGCSLTQMGIETLLVPPKLPGEQNEIYKALEKSVGKNIQLKYPRKGDYKSAITIVNIDEELTNEALVFYQLEAKPTSTMSLRVNVLDQRDGNWVSVYDMGIQAAEIEKVAVIPAGNINYIAIGCNLLAGKTEKVLQFFVFSDNRLEQQYSLHCNDYEIYDLDDDGGQEVITIISQRISEEETKTVATLTKIVDSGFVTGNTIDMDPTVQEYTAINKGKLDDGTPALYLDGNKGTGIMGTEILIISREKLRNLIYFPKKRSRKLVEQTERASGVLSIDLDNDGVYEIPQLKPFLGYESMEKHEQVFCTSWYHYDPTEKTDVLKTHYVSYTDYSLNYAFMLPRTWIDRVTAEVSIADNEVVFYEYDEKAQKKGLPILSIKVLVKSSYLSDQWNKKYQVLTGNGLNGQLVYLYYTHNQISKLAIEEKQIQKNLYLLP